MKRTSTFLMLFVYVALGILLMTPISTLSQAAVLVGPVTFQGHDYYLLDRNTWGASEAEAISLGGHLVTISNAEEHDFAHDFVVTEACLLSLPECSGAGVAWIGLNDVETEGTFAWTSGEPVTFTAWQPGEPNDSGGDEDFVEQGAFGERVWNDIGDHPILAVVEVVPEPSGSVMLVAGVTFLVVVAKRRSQLKLTIR